VIMLQFIPIRRMCMFMISFVESLIAGLG